MHVVLWFDDLVSNLSTQSRLGMGEVAPGNRSGVSESNSGCLRHGIRTLWHSIPNVAVNEDTDQTEAWQGVLDEWEDSTQLHEHDHGKHDPLHTLKAY